MRSRPLWLTRANGLTLLRLLAAPLLACAIVGGSELLAAALFWFSVATDVADGRVARRFGEASAYGRFLDHAADATFVTFGTAALAATGTLPAALPILIALAFSQYAIDSRMQGRREPRKSRLGHWNGIAYYVAVAVPVMRDALAIGWPGSAWVLAFGWLLIGTTLLSVAERLRFTLTPE